MTSATPAPALAPAVYSWQRVVPVTASLPRRGLALLVDFLVIAAATYALTLTLTAIGLLTAVPVALAGGAGDETIGFLLLVNLMELPVGLAYFTLLEGRWGRTLGKLVTGIRVASLKGTGVTMFDAFLRGLLRFLWITPVGPAFIVIDLYLVHATEMEQRIGDVAAGTVVILDDGPGGERTGP